MLRLEPQKAVTGSLAEDALNGRIDVFDAALPFDYPGLTSEELFADLFYLAMSAKDPDFISPLVPLESMALERLMLLKEGHGLREHALALCGSVKSVGMANYGATSLTTLLQMVAYVLGGR